MAEDQPQRVTLEDYSSSTMPQFFTSIARPESKQLLDASAGGKIKLKTPEEAMELIENMAASDHIPTKRNLLELSSVDALLAPNKLLAKLEVAVYVEERINLKSIESAIKNLEIQVGQLAKQIAENSSGDFGANAEKNPKEECKDAMTRSKREKKKEVVPCIGKEAPYPLVPSKKDKERHFARFLDIFKKLDITIPFGEALQQMPLYFKFLKNLLTKKGKYIHNDNIVVEGNCSAVIQRILPPKYKDLGSVTIPCSIGVVSVGKTIIDLGASINLMPLSMCRRIGELEIMPTRMTLQLADHSITRPYGVVEDVLVKVR
ncbi:uncharacterized protein [Glycine max]|uniref:uncharacterized protein n=1 Tax=Glycine max TaxID=3847 RepID=UPI0003DECB8F|nr:uncharacterized protein LOC102663238 [Glycine max]|eukprot:XP_006606637.1 uncharacterized protein LOC102663238 [Glycine max]